MENGYDTFRQNISQGKKKKERNWPLFKSKNDMN